MAWTAGPGELTSIDFGGTTITADLLTAYSLPSEKDSYDAAIGHSVDRGSILKRLSVDSFDVSAISAIHTLMTGRTETDVTVTYSDAQPQVLSNTIIRVMPLLNNVTDVCKVYVAASGTGNTSIATGWTDAGVTLDVPTLTASFPFDGTDGKGRPYFSSAGLEAEMILPGDVYSAFTEGAASRIAFELPDGNFQVMDGRVYKNFADDDGSRPRAVRAVLRGVSNSWGNLIEFTDGSATPTTEDFNAASPTIMQDRLHGFNIEAVGFGNTEADVVTF